MFSLIEVKNKRPLDSNLGLVTQMERNRNKSSYLYSLN